MRRNPVHPNQPIPVTVRNTITINLFIILLLTSSSLFADIASRGTDAGYISAFGKTKVKMVKENVYIKLYRDSAMVNCSFWMQTDSADELLNVAFPNCYNSRKFFIVSDCIRSFHCLVDSSPVVVKEISDSTIRIGQMLYNTWFQWQTSFRKGKLHRIDCSYVGKLLSHTFDYIIGTGNTWNGPIGEGRIVFDHSAICSRCFIRDPSTYLHTPYFSKGLRLIPTSFNDSIVYTFNNYLPDSSEKVAINIYHFWNYSPKMTSWDTISIIQDIHGLLYGFRNDFIFNYLADSSTFKHSNDFRAIKNELLARNGYPFLENDSLRKYFGNQVWYKPNMNFALLRINSQERFAIQILSSNLDSLRQVIDYVKKHRYSFELIDEDIKQKCNKQYLEAAIRKELLKTLNVGEKFLQPTLAIFGNKLEGKIEVNCEKNLMGRYIHYSTDITDTSMIHKLMMHMGLTEGSTKIAWPLDCAFSTKFSFKIRIIDRKSSVNSAVPFPE